MAAVTATAAAASSASVPWLPDGVPLVLSAGAAATLAERLLRERWRDVRSNFLIANGELTSASFRFFHVDSGMEARALRDWHKKVPFAVLLKHSVSMDMACLEGTAAGRTSHALRKDRLDYLEVEAELAPGPVLRTAVPQSVLPTPLLCFAAAYLTRPHYRKLSAWCVVERLPGLEAAAKECRAYDGGPQDVPEEDDGMGNIGGVPSSSASGGDRDSSSDTEESE